ncbi:MAG TPA: hypothetical protein VN822_05260 [Candidatus Acidoferrales bacterium]|nr:hypothetical protein [Candidatus Acidoferrales bacterium]
MSANLPPCLKPFFLFFEAIPERFLSYLMTVPGDPGQKDVMDV